MICALLARLPTQPALARVPDVPAGFTVLPALANANLAGLASIPTKVRLNANCVLLERSQTQPRQVALLVQLACILTRALRNA